MDKTIAGLLGVMGALAAAAPAAAGVAPPANTLAATRVTAYAELLKPIPNALALLKASAAADVQAELLPPAIEGDAPVQEAQLVLNLGHRHHHHHHHHRYYRRRHYHHHHHHH